MYRHGLRLLSLGAQSFDDKVLQWMHRTHSADQTHAAVRNAREAGIANLSLDLIFALPEALGRDWSRNVRTAIDLQPTHLSLYGLTIEPHTPLARWVRQGSVQEGPEDRYEAEFLQAHDLARAAGFDHYELSSFARPGFRSRHNAAYWLGAPYLGLGPAAHGYDGVARRWNAPAYAAWRRTVLASDDPVAGSETLSETNRDMERLYLQLRTTEGTVISEGERVMAEPWVRSKWAALSGDVLRLTPQGWLRMDAIVTALTHLRSHY